MLIRFSRAISTTLINTANIFVDGPLGSFAASSILLVSNLTYQLTFPPLTENGTYHFALSPTLLDVDGFQLDQNANGIAGEPEDGYEFTLILDTVPPRVTQSVPSGDIAGIATSVDVAFSERVDSTTLNAGTVSIHNPADGAVASSGVQEVGPNRWRFSFPAQTAVGQYHVFLSPNITDLAGNSFQLASGQLPSGVAFDASFNLVEFDLSDVVTSTNQFWSGDAVTVAWKGRNNSGAPLLGSWTDAVYLSKDDR